MRFDLAIAGGGPAGLAAAIRARQRGLAVVVLDKRRPPLDKPCGEGLMPDAVSRLEELGVRLPHGRSAPFVGIRYVDGEVVADGLFPRGTGLGVRRLDLHRAMVERAERAGVELFWDTPVEGLAEGGLRAGGEVVRARWIVAADGLRSPLRRAAGLDAGSPGEPRFGVRRHFCRAPWTDRVEVHWGPACEAYVTPVAPDEIGVAFLWSGKSAGGFDALLWHFPRLAEQLAGAPAASRDRGCGPLRQRVRRVYRGSLALLGDASGYVDAITGEGLALAFHQAFALIDAVEQGDLRRYARAHHRIGRFPDALTRTLLAVERRPRLRRRLIRTLAADPALFTRLLGIHARTLRPKDLGWTGAWRLARGLVSG
ncbi:MAG: NAD(P)/FAD-dependent oxidoreductase [Acidobacteria bacterium]|nr:NAD(P)/FAD-dependent oxidoreductase [Acidobacteriota bacterium]